MGKENNEQCSSQRGDTLVPNQPVRKADPKIRQSHRDDDLTCFLCNKNKL